MRMVRLLRLAAQAETLRWRRISRGYAIQAGLAAGAAACALLMLVMLQIAAFAWLSQDYPPTEAALIEAGGDLVLVVLLGWLAFRKARDPVAAEAEQVRDDALRQVGEQTAKAAMLMPLLRSQSARKGLAGAALTAAVVGLLARR